MLSTITLLTTWADFGFSPTFSRIIAFARGGGLLSDLHTPQSDCKQPNIAAVPLNVSSVLAAHRHVYALLITAGMLLATVGGTWALYRPIAGLAQPMLGWSAWFVTLASTLFVLMNGAANSVLTGFDKIADARRRDAVVGSLQLTSAVAVALLGGHVLAIVIVYFLWIVLQFGLNARHVTKISPPRVSHGANERDVIAAIWPAAWRSGVGILMSAGVIQVSGLIYAQFAAPKSAAAYLLAMRAMTSASQISQAPFYSKLPALAQLRAERRSEDLLGLATRGMVLAQWSFVACALAVMFGAPYLLKMIGSSVSLPPFDMLALLCAAFFAERYSSMHIQLYSLTNHIVWHIVNGVTGALMIGLYFAMRPMVGELAMPGAMLGAYGGFAAYFASRLSLKSLQIGRSSFEWRTTLGPLLVLVAGIGVGALIGGG